jgi:hypothetical protein
MNPEEARAARQEVKARVLGFTVEAIARAQRFAADLIDRLVRTAGLGVHLVACVTRRFGNAPSGVHATITVVRPDARRPPDATGSHGFAALLMYAGLTEDSVAVIMRSCADTEHDAAGHLCAIRGWATRRGRAVPMTRATIENVAGGRLGPHPCLPPHPQDGIRFETAYALREAK